MARDFAGGDRERALIGVDLPHERQISAAVPSILSSTRDRTGARFAIVRTSSGAMCGDPPADDGDAVRAGIHRHGDGIKHPGLVPPRR